MAGDIEAGGAVVRIKGKDQTKGDLDSAKQRFERFLSSVRAMSGSFNSSLSGMMPSMGTMIGMITGTGAGAGVLGGLGVLAKGFADHGSEIADIAARTGLASQEIGELGYAAQQTGASMQSLEGGMKGMAKFTSQLQSGAKGAATVMKTLGISQAEFMAASPAARMGLIADGLKNINDPALKAGLAMKVLGKAGVDLLPMLANGSSGMNAFAEEARRLRLPLTQDEVDLADKLGDSYDQTTAQMKTLGSVIGSAVAPSILAMIEAIQPAISSTIDFIRNNRFLITTLATVAFVVVAVGAAMLAGGLAVAGASAVAGMAITALTAIFSACVTVFYFLISPLGLLIIGLVGLSAAVMYGVYAFLRYTSIGQAMFAFISSSVSQLFGVVKTTLGAVWDFIASGNWRAAGSVMMLGLRVAMEVGLGQLRTLWIGFKFFLMDMMAQIASGLVARLQTGLAALVGVINAARRKLGLEEIDVGDYGGRYLQGMKSKIDAFRMSNKQVAADEKAASDARVAASKAALDLARANAAEARKNSVKLPPASKFSLPSLAGMAIKTTMQDAQGSSLGAYSASVAALLGRSGNSAAEKAAKAAEKTAENTDDIKSILEKIREEGGLAFE